MAYQYAMRIAGQSACRCRQWIGSASQRYIAAITDDGGTGVHLNIARAAGIGIGIEDDVELIISRADTDVVIDDDRVIGFKMQSSVVP